MSGPLPRSVSVLGISLALALAVHAVGQAPAAASPPPLVKLPNDASKQSLLPAPDGIPLSVITDVNGSVTVDAVLLPAAVCKRIFGATIANNYAAVQMTVSNRNPDAALIIQSAFLDYSDWLFSGDFGRVTPLKTQKWQSPNTKDQIASTEARLVRGDLQDAQLWTWRNGFIRGVTAVATIASGFQFVTTSQDVIRGIGAFGNQVVPAMGTFWPDSTQLQINRISDFGFQTNHVIPKQGSDIVVAFFPLDRFLTPGLKQIFLKSPAAFFVPGQMVLDPKYRKVLGELLQNAGFFQGKTADQAANAISTAFYKHEQLLQSGTTGGAPELTLEEKTILYMLDRVSLNNVHVVIGGIMTIDTNAVPATISSITFDADTTKDTTWKSGKSLSGIVTGSFLSGGVPSILGASTLGIGEIKVDSSKSTDKELYFSFALSKDIASGTSLPFVVTKQTKDGASTTSAGFPFAVSYATAAAPAAAPPQAPGATEEKGAQAPKVTSPAVAPAQAPAAAPKKGAQAPKVTRPAAPQ